MRASLLPLFLLIAALYSCKKNDFDASAIRLLKTESVDSAGNVYNTTFEFDQEGRITKLSGVKNNGTPSVGLIITYSGNVATFSDGPWSNGPLYENRIVRYQLNNDHQPILRTEYDSFFISPPEPPQRTIKTDSTRYEYDAAGLLKKVTGTYIDSTWTNQGFVQTSTIRSTYTRDYTNSNGKLTGITTHVQEKSITKNASYQASSSSTTEGTHTFEYPHNEPHKTDFSNTWLLAELHILYEPEYPLTSSYSYFPEKVTYSEVTKDANGQIINTRSDSRTLMLDLNSFGFISAYTPDGRAQNKVKLIYNR